MICIACDCQTTDINEHQKTVQHGRNRLLKRARESMIGIGGVPYDVRGK